ncbi:hypothetical protein DL96DRAFT_1238477 [Flagelloscypha sp. PMI_526]|nr:hypothetical protein DL96DRAFT_1238477 [Flagelloscypha sp. PMI_526]
MISRTDKPAAVGGTGGTYKESLFSGDSYHSIITSALYRGQEPPTDASSTLGQASTIIACDDDSFDRVCGKAERDPSQWILEEELEDEPGEVLPIVPTLPPLTQCGERTFALPINLQGLLAKGGEARDGWMTKVQGVPSLNKSLSWVPCPSALEKAYPTHDGVCDVSTPFTLQERLDLDRDEKFLQLQQLVDGHLSDQHDDMKMKLKLWKNLAGAGREHAGLVHSIGDEKGFLLTREERLRTDGDIQVPPAVIRTQQEQLSSTRTSTKRCASPLFNSTSTKQSRLSPDLSSLEHDLSDDGPRFAFLPPSQDSFLEEESSLLAVGSPPIRYQSPHRHNDNYNPVDFGAEKNYSPTSVGAGDSFHPLSFPQSGWQIIAENDSDGEVSQDFGMGSTARAMEPILNSPRSYAENLIYEGQDTAQGVFPEEDRGDSNLVNLRELATQTLGINHFAHLRARTISVPPPASTASFSIASPAQQHEQTLAPLVPPISKETLYDKETILLPIPPLDGQGLPMHRYFASLDFIQRQVLVRSLRNCAVGLVERQHLSGVDLIVDPFSCIILAPLFMLPSDGSTVLQNIATTSWSYSTLLVIFEAYPEHRAIRAARKQASSSSEEIKDPCAYTPPIVKAIRKLRREVAIAAATGVKNPECQMRWAFADSVDETAVFSRHFGELMENSSSESEKALWVDGREWLDGDVPEHEEDLASLSGMNVFAAFVILCQVDAQTLIDYSPEERIAIFGPHVGSGRMDMLNRTLAQREEALDEDVDVVTALAE